MSAAALVLLAAGSGSRTGHATNKVFLPLAGRSVLTWSLDHTASMPQIEAVVLVVRDDEMAAARAVLRRESPDRDVRVVPGGPTRHGSEWNALRSLQGDIRSGAVDVVVVHDAARPLSGRALFLDVVRVARAHGGAVPGIRLRGLLGADLRPSALDGVTVQTPQAFRAKALLAAHEEAQRTGFEGTDTAACLERFGTERFGTERFGPQGSGTERFGPQGSGTERFGPQGSGTERLGDEVVVRLLPGSASNIKITFPGDLLLAEALLARTSYPERGAQASGSA